MKLRALLEDWLSLRPALVHVYEGPVAVQGRNIDVPPGGNHFAWLLERGSVTVTQEGGITSAKAGEWLICTPGARRQVFTREARIISVHFQMKWPDGCNLFEKDLSRKLPAATHPRLEKEARALLKAMKGVLPADPPKIRKTPLTVEQYFAMQQHGMVFLTTLAEVLGAEGLIPSRVGLTDERLLEALRRLDHHPLDHPLDDRDLARRSGPGLSPDRLARLFRVTFGVTPTGYFENRRRDYARRLLGHSATPAKEIASRLGFRSLSDFSSWFKRAHGLSPRAFRNSPINEAYL